MATKLNSKGSAHAGKLVTAGKITKGDTWDPASPNSENKYIKENGISEWGKFFLGIDTDVPLDTKEHYKYPYSNDWKTIHRKGIIAAKTRAAQQGAIDIENRADSLLKKIDGKTKASFFDINGEINFFG